MNRNKMKQLRVSTKISTEEATKRLSISYSMLTKIERADRTPSVNLIDKMSKLYKCSIDDIYKALRNEEG